MNTTKIKTTAFLLFIGAASVFSLTNCNSNADASKSEVSKSTTDEVASVDSTAYKMMEQKCTACHMLKPDPSKRGAMLAPPMMRIKEHYAPSNQTREEFVNAVAAFVLNPTEDAVLMPGAVRKFKIMPNLGLTEQDAKLIAEAIYDTDFGSMPKMQMEHSGSLSLNDGAKWKLKPENVATMHAINEKLNSFDSENIEDYNQLGKDVFADIKTVLLDQDYKDSLVQQLHFFFGGAEGDLHDLQSCKSVEDGKKLVEDLKQKFSKFDTYFEE